MSAQTIEIFLPDGEPRGLRIAGITTRIVQAIQVPRTKLDRFYARNEAQRVALYFLFGPTGEGAKPRAYVGQTEDLVGRLKKHNAEKDFWQTAVAIVSRTESFTQVHVRYLEWRSLLIAKEAARFMLDNGNAGSKPYIPEPLEADVLDVFETASTLLATLGFPLFESVADISPNGNDIFFCRGKLGDGRGRLVDDGFVVFKDSLFRKERIPSATGYLGTREGLEASGLLVVENEQQLRLLEDYVCRSPSEAAAIVLGRNANGWIEWKRDDGRTLDEIFRQTEGRSEEP